MTIAGQGAQTHQASLLERLPLMREQPWRRYAATLALVAAAVLIRLAFSFGGFPFITAFPAVLVAAFLFGARAAILTAVAAGALSIWLFIPPGLAAPTVSQSSLPAAFYLLTCALIISLIHWMQTAHARLSEERRRSAALAENRELLFRELQHRVSNNLQVVAALLALQKRHVADDDARAALDEASRRLGLIGRIHRQLYEPTGERIGMAPFLRQLAADVVDSAGAPGTRLKLEVDEALDLNADAAISVALIVSEALSNAVEHGLCGAADGTIRLAMAQTGEGGILIEVADDGPGLPDGFAPDQSPSLGLRIASTLARQLGGTFEVVSADGAIARLTLPRAAIA